VDVISVFIGGQSDKYIQITGCGQVISTGPMAELTNELVGEYLAV
jgi:hypothetical protein